VPTTAITIREDQMLIALGQLGVAVNDVPDMLRIVGAYMLGSVAKTFRNEGSPAGSWPALADSTKKRKGYTAGHKLLILSGRLFGSIQAVVMGKTLSIGTGLVYAAVHQWGSLDRKGGSVGAQAKIEGRGVHVDAYSYMRVIQKENKAKGLRRIRLQTKVAAHDRHQNIPARPYLVFRPEDPSNVELAIAGWIRSKAPAVKA
jgi:phage virion morphogenesis protein